MLYSKSRGGRIVFQKYNFTIIKDKYRLWKCFRFKEAKEMWHLNVVPDPRLDPAVEGETAMKDTIRLSDKIDQGVLPDQCKIIQGPHGGR